MKHKIIILRLQNFINLSFIISRVYVKVLLLFLLFFLEISKKRKKKKKRNGSTSKKYNWNYTFINISIFPSRVKGLSVLSSPLLLAQLFRARLLFPGKSWRTFDRGATSFNANYLRPRFWIGLQVLMKYPSSVGSLSSCFLKTGK